MQVGQSHFPHCAVFEQAAALRFSKKTPIKPELLALALTLIDCRAASVSCVMTGDSERKAGIRLDMTKKGKIPERWGR